MPPTTDLRIARLEQELNSLKLQLRGSPGVSTASAGAVNFRTLQIGFAAQLTSDYDDATGYSWKRLRLTPPDFVNPGVQPTGENAFEISGDETLDSGTNVWMEPSPDGVGWIFTLSGASEAGDGDNCTAPVSLLRPGFCGTVTLLTTEGACDCVTAGQSTSLTWDEDADSASGEDYVYGCSPGVVTTRCPTGAPRKYVTTVSGYTGVDCVDLNGTWTFTYSSSGGTTPTYDEYTATLNGISATMRIRSDGTALLTFQTPGEQSYAVNSGATCCSELVFEIDANGCGDDSPPATLTATPATACGVGTPYTVVVDICEDSCGRPEPRMRLVPAAGSGAATITLSNAGCGSDYLDFSTSSPIFCTGTSTECSPNRAVFRVQCGACAGVECSSCPDAELSRYFCVTFSNVVGCDCLEGTQLFLIYYDYDQVWTGYVVTPCTTEPAPGIIDEISIQLTMQCTGNPGQFLIDDPVGRWAELFEIDCVTGFPVTLTGVESAVSLGDCASGFTLDMTITEIASLGDCEANAYTPSYNCLESGSCVDPGDGSGEFTGGDALADCTASCGGSTGDCTELDAHPDLEVLLETNAFCDGAGSGFSGDCLSGNPYTAVWNGGSSRWEFTGSFSGATYTVAILSPGVMQLGGGPTGFNADSGPYNCSPFLCVIQNVNSCKATITIA